MRLNQVTLPCTSYDASVEFYRRMGLVQIVDAPPRYARFESADGHGATLSVHAVQDVSPHAVVVYFDHDSAEALDAHVASLEARGLRFSHGPRDEPWGWREARLLDPAGNTVCLMFAGENRRFPPWRLDTGSESGH